MPAIRFPYPDLGNASQTSVVDPDEIMANFYELFRLVNGNLGPENTAQGNSAARAFTNAMMMNQRSIGLWALHIDTSQTFTGGGATWPLNVNQVIGFPLFEVYLGAFVSGATADFKAELYVGATLVATIVDIQYIANSGKAQFWTWFVTAPAVGTDKLFLKVISGSCGGIDLFFSSGHTV